MANPKRGSLPFIWPPAIEIESDDAATNWYEELDWAPNSVRSISGIVAGVNESGVGFLSGLLAEHPRATCRVLLLLSPASSPNEQALSELLDLQGASNGRLQLRLETSQGESTTTLCLVKAESNQTLLLTGPASNFLLEPGIAPNFLMDADSGLVEAWRTWYQAMWADATPLTVEATRVPHLVPAAGDTRAVHLWWEYETLLVELKRRSEEAGSAESAPDAEGNQEQNEAGADATAGTDPLGLDLAALQQRLKELYAKGQLLTIDQSSRVPTLDCPIRPEWLGWTRERSVGRIKHRSEFRIPLLGEQDRERFEKLRERLTKILPRFTYLLGDRVRWIPVGAIPLLERDMAQIDAEGQQHLGALLKGNIEEFVEKQREQIVSSATNLIRERAPKASLTQDALEKILMAVRERLGRAQNGHFAPKMTLTTVQAPNLAEAGHVSGWGQALKLLHEIAVYPRKAVTTSSRLAPEFVQLRLVMDVLKDHIWVQPHLAKYQLDLIDWVMSEDVKEQQKCQWLLDLIDGKGQQVEAALIEREHERNGTDRR